MRRAPATGRLQNDGAADAAGLLVTGDRFVVVIALTVDVLASAGLGLRARMIAASRARVEVNALAINVFATAHVGSGAVTARDDRLVEVVALAVDIFLS